jgi:hypothetical protein
VPRKFLGVMTRVRLRRALVGTAIGLAITAGPLVWFRIRVLGGEEAPADAWVVKVHSHCTGTIVGRRAVLTAAHCVASPIETNVRIDIDGQGTLYAECRRHGNFTVQPHADVALCTLPEDVGIRPRPVARAATISGRPVVFFGFGCPVVDLDDFFGVRRKGQGTGNLQASGVLQVDNGNGMCDGDSGGPVVLDDEHGVVAGVLSRKGPGYRPDAWSVTAEATSAWFAGHANEICFEGASGGPCDVTVRHTSNSAAVGRGVHGPIAQSVGAKMMPLRE